MVIGAHAYSTIMDFSPDSEANMKTFAVKFGKRFSAFFACFTFIIGIVVGDIQFTVGRYYLLFCAIIFAIAGAYPNELLCSCYFKLIWLAGGNAAVIFFYTCTCFKGGCKCI